jgi:hypothetical protein
MAGRNVRKAKKDTHVAKPRSIKRPERDRSLLAGREVLAQNRHVPGLQQLITLCFVRTGRTHNTLPRKKFSYPLPKELMATPYVVAAPNRRARLQY